MRNNNPTSQVAPGIYRTKDGRFRAVARTNRTNRRDKVFAIQADAEAWRTWAMNFLLNGKAIPTGEPVSERPRTVGHICALWLSDWKDDKPDLSPEQKSKRENQTKVIARWFGSQPFETVHRRRIAAFRTHLGKDKVKSTADDYLYIIKNAFDLAIGEGWITTNPAHKVYARDYGAGSPLGARPRLDAHVVQTVPIMLRPAFQLPFWCQLLTGLRRGELFGLKVMDIDFARHVIHVRRQRGLWRKVSGEVTYIKNQPKGGKSRTAALPSLLEAMLMRYLQTTGKVADPEAFVFDLPRRSSQPYQDELRAALLKLGVVSANGKPVGTHNLRHEYINLLIEFSGDGALASRAAGHEVRSAGRTTRKHYIHKLLAAREVKRIRKHMDKYIRTSLGGACNLGKPEWNPGEEWMAIQEAAAVLGFASTQSVGALVKKGKPTPHRHRPKGQNVFNAYVRRSDVERVKAERDSHMSRVVARAKLGLTQQHLTRAMGELEMEFEPKGLSIAQVALLEAYIHDGEQFRCSHVNRGEVSALLRLRAGEVSSRIASGHLTVVAAEGFQPDGYTTWFSRNQVNRIMRSMPAASVRRGRSSVAAAGRRIGVSDATVRRLVKGNELMEFRLDHRVLISNRSIQQYIAKRDAMKAKLVG